MDGLNEIYDNSNVEEQKEYVYKLLDEVIEEYLQEFLNLRRQNEKKFNFDSYISKLNDLKNNKDKYIKFDDKKNNYTAETITGKQIALYTVNFKYANTKGLKLTLIHELKHFLGLDRDNTNLLLLKQVGLLDGKDFVISDLLKSFEVNTNISTIRRYMEKLGFSLDDKGLKEFEEYYKKNYNNLSYNEKIEIQNFFDLFKGRKKKINKEDIIFLLNKLVILDNTKSSINKAKNKIA